MATEDDVRAASKNFYAALNRSANGDTSLLDEIWSSSDTATAMHPLGGRDVGWDAVRQSFEQFAQIASDGDIQIHDQIVNIAGDTAYELGFERGQCHLAGQMLTVDSRVTNIYRRENDGWKIIHHHSDFSDAFAELLKTLG